MGIKRNKCRRIMASFNTLINAATLLLIGVIALTSVASEPPYGGWSDEAPAGPQVQDIADSVQSQVEDLIHGGRPFPEYQAVKYSVQVVAGARWAILMQIAGGEHAYIQIMLFEPLSYLNESNTLTNVQTGLTENTTVPLFPLVPF